MSAAILPFPSFAPPSMAGCQHWSLRLVAGGRGLAGWAMQVVLFSFLCWRCRPFAETRGPVPKPSRLLASNQEPTAVVAHAAAVLLLHPSRDTLAFMFETHYTPRITSHAVAASNIGERLLLLACLSQLLCMLRRITAALPPAKCWPTARSHRRMWRLCGHATL